MGEIDAWPPHDDERIIPFLADVRVNLALVREAHGPDSDDFQRLLGHYREIAAELGRLPAFERIVRALGRRRLGRQRYRTGAKGAYDAAESAGSPSPVSKAVRERYTGSFRAHVAKRLAAYDAVLSRIIRERDGGASSEADRWASVIALYLSEDRAARAPSKPDHDPRHAGGDYNAVERIITRLIWTRGADTASSRADEQVC